MPDRTPLRHLIGGLGVSLALAALPAAGDAQAPDTLTFPIDSLLALAADSADYPEEAALALLVDGTVRLEADGTGERTFRFAWQLLRQEALRALAERTISYDAGREEFTLHWARVLDRDGNVVSAEPIHFQELDEPVPTQSPIYTNRKRVRLSMGGLEPGHILDYSYTVHLKDPAMAGNLWLRRGVNGAGTLRRYRLRVDLPEALEPRMRLQNVEEPEIRRADGRLIRQWRFADVERVQSEPFAADSNGVAQSITLSPPLEWDDVARWYADLAAGRYAPLGPELEAKLADIVADAVTREDSLRAVHRWVAQDIRYVSISLGLGGYQPRPPAEVLATASGDCKDKATLFIALVRHMGVEAYPVIVSTGAAVRTDMPSISQFNHMVVALRAREGEPWHFLDLTVSIAPYDEVYGGLQGRDGILLRDDGTAEPVRFPTSPVSANRSVIEMTGSIDENGAFLGRYVEYLTGSTQYRIRSEFARRLTEKQMGDIARNVANRVFEGAAGDSLVTLDGNDLTAEPRLEARVTAEGVLRPVGSSYMLRLQLPRYGSRAAVDALQRERRFPIDVEKVFGRREHVTLFRITLPEGWNADLPESVHAESAFGTYSSSYRQEGRELIVERVVRGTDGILPPERKDELIGWFEAMLADHVEYVMISPPAGGG